MTLTIHSFTFDCRDAQRTSAFWSAALGRPVADGASPTFAMVSGTESAPALMFIAVPEGKTVKNRAHLDLSAEDREAEVARLLDLGATRHSDHDENGFRWTTLLDVEGNEFCVV
jgi:catechol 2,3-dioxygenase-like lactoylglutathione lyase family enzyme